MSAENVTPLQRVRRADSLEDAATHIANAWAIADLILERTVARGEEGEGLEGAARAIQNELVAATDLISKAKA